MAKVAELEVCIIFALFSTVCLAALLTTALRQFYSRFSLANTGYTCMLHVSQQALLAVNPLL